MFDDSKLSRLGEKYDSDLACRKELDDKLSVRQTLENYGMTALNPKSTDDIAILVNEGVDVKSGKYALEQNGSSVYGDMMAQAKEHLLKARNDDLGYNNLTDDEKKTMSREDYIVAERQKALDCVQSALDTSLNEAFVTSSCRYGSEDMTMEDRVKEYMKSQNEMIVEQGTKGKPEQKTFDSLSAYLSVDWGTKTETRGDKEVTLLDTDKPVTVYDKPFIEMQDEVDEKLQAKFENMEQRWIEVNGATATKSFGTGSAGTVSQRMAKAMRDDPAFWSGLEMSYGATQGTLQTKHSAAEAEQKFLVLKYPMPAVWKGNRVTLNEDGMLVPMIDKETGYPVKAKNAQEWIEDYKLVLGPHGMNCDLHEDHIRAVANKLFDGPVDDRGEKTFINVYKEDTGCTLDQLAYNPTWENLVRCADNGQNLFDSNKASQFKPDDALVQESLKQKKASQIIRDMVESYSPTREAERQAEREAAFNEKRIKELSEYQMPEPSDHEANDKKINKTLNAAENIPDTNNDKQGEKNGVGDGTEP